MSNAKKHMWRVVPLSKGQLLDVRPDDILEKGLYRRCDTYRGGGGYDLFPRFAQTWLGKCPHHQFIVQLFGCNLDCPYCYVTRAGVWGTFKLVTTDEMISAFERSGQEVFHLMGGAPALQLPHWRDIADRVSIFHSDLMLTERPYHTEWLTLDSAILAINVKGLNDDEWLHLTRKQPRWDLFWKNWCIVEQSGVRAYITFTGVDRANLPRFWSEVERRGLDVARWRRDSYVIDLINYSALEHVDDIPWGKGHG